MRGFGRVTAYATRRDVYRYGLARGALGSAARLVATSAASTDTLTLDEHGFETDDEVILRATDGGTLSAPLVYGTTYYVIRVSDSAFKLAATQGGSAINLTTDGVSMTVSIALPFDDVLEFYSRFVDAFLPAHLVPLTSPYPVTVVATVAELTAKKLQLLSGQMSGSMTETELAAKAQLERWAKGIPLRDATATKSANLAITSALGAATDPRGWGSGSLP